MLGDDQLLQVGGVPFVNGRQLQLPGRATLEKRCRHIFCLPMPLAGVLQLLKVKGRISVLALGPPRHERANVMIQR